MRSIILAIIVICYSNTGSAQANSSIHVGDTYEHVVSKIEADPAFNYYEILKNKNRIVVYNRPGSGLGNPCVMEYHFKNKVLVRQLMIMNPPDPDAFMSFVYQNADPKPPLVTKNGHKAYYWAKSERNCKTWIYKAYSSWYDAVCVITHEEK